MFFIKQFFTFSGKTLLAEMSLYFNGLDTGGDINCRQQVTSILRNHSALEIVYNVT